MAPRTSEIQNIRFHLTIHQFARFSGSGFEGISVNTTYDIRLAATCTFVRTVALVLTTG